MKFRLGLALAAVLLASLAAVASASAAACTELAGAGCIEVEGNLTETLLLTGKKETGTGSILVAKNPSISIECETAVPLENALAENGVTIDETETMGIQVLPFDIIFENCKVPSHPLCKVANIETSLIVGSATELSGTETDINFKPETGTTFATIPVTNCEQEANVVVKTEKEGAIGQLCTVPAPDESVKVKLLACTTAGSKLFVGGDPATFTLTEELEATKPYTLLVNWF